jgi:arsenate reductase-like glutaredoxin family protein
MELLKFINDNQIGTYENLKDILEKDPYHLKVKDDQNKPNLFLIHNTDKSNSDLTIVRECNGIILEKNTFKIVCYTFDKCIESNELNDKIDIDNLYVENAIEGTLVRLFYYNNAWNICTKKCIDASKSKWISDKSFEQLFNEAMLKYNPLNVLQLINQNYCYSFIVVHPENNIIVKYTEPEIYHISTRNMESLLELNNINIGLPNIERQKISKDNLNDIYNAIQNDISLANEGMIFIDNQCNRHKIKNPYFIKVRSLWGNTNNRMMRYLELRKNIDLLKDYLSFFPYDQHLFASYELIIYNLANEILQVYVKKHIKKVENMKIPYFFAKTIYKLHGNFIKNKIITDINIVLLCLHELEPKNILYMLHHYNKNMEKNNNTTNNDTNNDTINDENIMDTEE